MGVRALGVNHVAFEVDDLDEALAWWARYFAFELRGRVPGMAFIDLGDQFVALARGLGQGPDAGRHFGLVVDGKEAVREALRAAGVEVPASGRLAFHDPWGNRVEVVDYADVQFSKTPAVLAALGLEGLQKTEAALAEMRAKRLGG